MAKRRAADQDVVTAALRTIDLNCDCGESFGAWQMGDDAALLPWVSSANIACGFHAGDPQTMLRTIELCQQHGVAIGAHPGLRDLQGFGRRGLRVNANDVLAETLYQIGALTGLCSSRGVRLQHVKPHGALYHQLDGDAGLADAFVAAVGALDSRLYLVGPSNGALQAAATRAQLGYWQEGFVERGYAADGRLLARDQPGAVLDNHDAIVAQACELALRARVRAGDRWIPMPVQTLCIHGDRPDAPELARQIRLALQGQGVKVCAAHSGDN